MSNAVPATTERAPLPRPVSAWIYASAVAGLVVGLAAFVLGALGPTPAAAWQALLINFLFWSSLAQGAFLWSVAFRIARTTWSAPINRLGHSAIWFLGLSLLVFALLFAGRRFYLPWVTADLGDRAIWLSVPFLFLRDGVGLLLLFLFGLAYVRTYLRHDSNSVEQVSNLLPWRVAARRLSVLGVVLAVLYTITATLIAFDLIMSLLPAWYSALFGWYYWLGGLYGGMAALIVMAVLLRRWLGADLGRQHFQDLGNLLMALAMAMTYFFFAQALTIWYENSPPETVFALPRVHHQPWQALSWVLIGVCYLGPFALLAIREMKENPRTLCAVALLVLAGLWFERYLLIVPSLTPRYPGFPILVPLIGAGFLGAFILTTAPFLARLPAESPLDLALTQEREAWS